MKIIDTAGRVERDFSGQPFDLQKWQAYAESISPELAQKCREGAGKYDFEGQVRPVLQASLGKPEKLRELHSSFRCAVQALRANAPALFGREPEVTIVLYLGLCNAAGQATRLGGSPALLLGMEKIIELDWCGEKAMKALLFHELGHLWHESLRGELENWGNERQRAVLQLYSEGVAMVCQQRLAGEPELFHQDRDGWLSWCRENEPSIKAAYRERLEKGESIQGFFGDWVRFMGQPDVGYFLGRQFVGKLLAQWSLEEAAMLPYGVLEKELTSFLTNQ